MKIVMHGFALVLAAGLAAAPVLEAQDTTLARLMQEAQSSSPDLRGAHARVRQARAARTGALLDLAPQVEAQAGYTRLRQSSVYAFGAPTMPDQGLWDGGLVMGWEVDVFGRGRHLLQGRDAAFASAQENTRDVQVLLAN